MRKAPAGCFWRNGVLFGRAKVAGRDFKWSLRTDDPKVAKQRRKDGAERLVAGVRYGDARTTFDEAMAAWAPWIEKQVGPKTVARYACSLGQLGQWLKGKYLDQIQGQLIAQIIRERKATNATIKRDLNALSSVINFAIGQGWMEINPVLPRLKLIKERRDPIVLPLPHDIQTVLERCPPGLRALARAARVTGARQEELAGARRSQLDLERRRLELIGKGNKRRVIDLNLFEGWKVFEALPSSAGFLFWHGKGQRYENVSSRFSGLSQGLFRFHDLRHLHAVEWLQSGRSIYDLQQRLGHASIKTTEGYLQFLTPEEKRKAMGQ